MTKQKLTLSSTWPAVLYTVKFPLTLNDYEGIKKKKAYNIPSNHLRHCPAGVCCSPSSSPHRSWILLLCDVIRHCCMCTYVMSSVLKLTIMEIKFSLMMTPLRAFQSRSNSPSNTQIDSTASLTAAGGLFKVRTSTKCCFLMDLTAGMNRTTIKHMGCSKLKKKTHWGDTNLMAKLL